MQGREPVPVACTLDLRAMGPRLADIRQLTLGHLKSHRLERRALRLTYDVVAAAKVAAIVEAERVCCAFLDFELEVSADAVQLTITAPEQEDTDAGWLFAQFLPDATGAPTGGCECCRG